MTVRRLRLLSRPGVEEREPPLHIFRDGDKLLTNNVITPSQKAVIIAGFLNNQAGELNHNE